MPQASDEQHELMRKWFGAAVYSGSIKFLEAHGYVLRRDCRWEKPTPSHTVSAFEWECVYFLIDEWGFGGCV